MTMMAVERVPENEAFIDTLPENEKSVYRFMRDKYDEVTNDGDDYQEQHDEEVAQVAATEFNISSKEAGDIYTAVEMKLADFYNKRKGSYELFIKTNKEYKSFSYKTMDEALDAFDFLKEEFQDNLVDRSNSKGDNDTVSRIGVTPIQGDVKSNSHPVHLTSLPHDLYFNLEDDLIEVAQEYFDRKTKY